MPKQVTINEVGPRDGFQSISEWIQTEDKIKIILMLEKAGISSMEITSFVHPQAIPQLKDAEKVVGSVTNELSGVDIRALVPNLRGTERAVLAGVKKIKTMLSATDSHSLSNANSTVADAQDKLEQIYEFAAKNDVTVMGSISVAFGCPFEGPVPIERLIKIIDRYIRSGVQEISLADSTGVAQPKQVYETLGVLKSSFPDIEYSMHLHNTRGMALANTLAALQQGVTKYDSSIAGLGGCPYLPNATGNVATEDLVHMLGEMGIHTGINLKELLQVAEESRNITGVKGESYLLTAGPILQINERPDGQHKVGEYIPKGSN